MNVTSLFQVFYFYRNWTKPCKRFMELHPELTPMIMASVIVVFFLAGIIKGTLGIGLPTAAVSLMALFLEPKTALALAVLPILVINFRQFFSAVNPKPVAYRFRIMALFIFISLGITTYFTARLESEQIRLVIGSAICLFCITSYTLPDYRLPQNGDWILQGFFGLLSGIIGGLTSIWAPPIVIYLLGRQVEKETFIAATGFLFSVGSIPLLTGFILNGMLSPELGLFSLICILPSLFGFRIGMRIRFMLSQILFRQLVLLAFLLAGLRFIWLD